MNKWAFIGSKIFPQLSWSRRGDTSEKKVFITFDDGPHPVITMEVLDILAKYDAKATFFVVGENAEKYPETIRKIKAAQHKIGNHTMHHLKGWSVSLSHYLQDIEACEKACPSDGFFRPPYGRIKKSAIEPLMEKYEIVMWDVLTKDYLSNLNLEHAFATLKKQIKPGSIIVFHDSEKAYSQMIKLLPRLLSFLSDNQYQLCSL